jgi:hypothetical protein
MTPEIETALKKAAVEARCIDADLVLTPIFADIVATVKAESDAPGAIEAMRQAKPRLFKQDEWGTLSPDDFQAAEKRLKERLSRRTQPAARNSDYRELDAALLSAEEAGALRRFLGGHRSTYDRSVLSAALKRQNGPDAA